MADTIQTVNWCIEYACPFRQGAAVCQVGAATEATRDLRSINVATSNNDVYDDYCVLGVGYSLEGRQPIVSLRISDTVRAVGSLAEARRTCGACPASASNDGQLAGCCGYLMPDDEGDCYGLGASAKRVIREQLNESFELTRPPWYGLWIRSPLNAEQCAALLHILPQATSEQTISASFVAPANGQ